MSGVENLLLAGAVVQESEQTKLVRAIFDIDRVLLDTERFKSSGREEIRPYDEDRGALARFSSVARFSTFSEEQEPGLQRQKLAGLGIAHLFRDENTHIVSGDKVLHLPRVIEQYRGEFIALLDDRIQVLVRARELGVQLPILIRRGPYAAVIPIESLKLPFARDLNVAFDILSQMLVQGVHLSVLGQSTSAI